MQVDAIRGGRRSIQNLCGADNIDARRTDDSAALVYDPRVQDQVFGVENGVVGRCRSGLVLADVQVQVGLDTGIEIEDDVLELLRCATEVHAVNRRRNSGASAAAIVPYAWEKIQAYDGIGHRWSGRMRRQDENDGCSRDDQTGDFHIRSSPRGICADPNSRNWRIARQFILWVAQFNLRCASRYAISRALGSGRCRRHARDQNGRTLPVLCPMSLGAAVALYRMRRAGPAIEYRNGFR